MTGPVIGVIGAATAFGLVWHMWWLAIIGVLAIITTVIARSFARDVHEDHPRRATWRAPKGAGYAPWPRRRRSRGRSR